jgi:hypothetical protein
MNRLVFAAAVLVLANCSPAQKNEPAPMTGFVSDKANDLFGYYLPLHEIRVGKFKLDHLALATPDEFRSYEAAKDRRPTFAPVMLAFSDITSRQLTNELGQPYFENAPRALPTAYRVNGGTITFVGGNKQVGPVTFSGTLDLAALKAVQNMQPSDSTKSVLKGDLTIAGKTFKGVTFGWFGGD